MRAAQVVQREVAAIDDLERGEQLALEQLGAAAVVRQGRDHAHHRQLAEIARAVFAFQPPDRDDDETRHAELLLDAREQRGVARQHLLALGDAIGRDAGARVLLEVHAERAALAAVERDGRGIVRDAGEGGLDGVLRDALRCGLARHRRDEGGEVPVALGGEGGRREREAYRESRERAAEDGLGCHGSCLA